MSSSHQHQENQKRHTNIAVVRLRKGGSRFEVAAYPNKVSEYRSGVEKSMDDVLQVFAVYTSVSRGVHASKAELESAFGTSDVVECCKFILTHGDIQVGEKERHEEYSSKFRDIATLVAGRCVNTQTGWPFTVASIEAAMHNNLHFAVNPSRPIKQQAMEVIERLREFLPIARARMHLKLAGGKPGLEEELREMLEKASAASQSATAAAVAAAAKRSSTGGGKKGGGKGAKDPGGAAAAASDAEHASVFTTAGEILKSSDGVVEVVIDPHLFRDVEQLVKKFEGTLSIVEFAVHASAETDLEAIPGGARVVRAGGAGVADGAVASTAAASAATTSTATSTAAATPMTTAGSVVAAMGGLAVSGATRPGALKCSACQVEFADAAEQRKHHKSEFHTYNLKLKQTGLPPVTAAEFGNMSEEDKRAVLFDWKTD